jgi:hypothetical protein
MDQVSWAPTIPAEYTKPPAEPTLPVIVSASRDAASSASTITTADSTTNSGASGTSGRTTRTLPVRNTNVNSMFDPHQEKLLRTKLTLAIDKAGLPPKVTREGVTFPMCASYHLKGNCWTHCARAKDHGPHTQAEDKLLLTWCEAAYAA